MALLSNFVDIIRTSSGNIGIGTITPTEKLTVAGNILTTGTLTANNIIATGSITAGSINAGFVPIQAYGGNVTVQTVNGRLWQYHTFTTVGSSTFSVAFTGIDGKFEYLVVGGGGGGGDARKEGIALNNAINGAGVINVVAAGGGGGGGCVLLSGFNVGSGVSSNPGTNYTIVVGEGGIGSNPNQSNGLNGGRSLITGLGLTAIAPGGGGGGWAIISIRNDEYPTYTDVSNGSNGGTGGGGGKARYDFTVTSVTGRSIPLEGRGTGGSGTTGLGLSGGTPVSGTSDYSGGGGGSVLSAGANTGEGGIGTNVDLSNMSNLTLGPGGTTTNPLSGSSDQIVTVNGVTGTRFGEGGGGGVMRVTRTFTSGNNQAWINSTTTAAEGGNGYQGVVIIRYPITA